MIKRDWDTPGRILLASNVAGVWVPLLDLHRPTSTLRSAVFEMEMKAIDAVKQWLAAHRIRGGKDWDPSPGVRIGPERRAFYGVRPASLPLRTSGNARMVRVLGLGNAAPRPFIKGGAAL